MIFSLLSFSSTLSFFNSFFIFLLSFPQFPLFLFSFFPFFPSIHNSIICFPHSFFLKLDTVNTWINIRNPVMSYSAMISRFKFLFDESLFQLFLLSWCPPLLQGLLHWLWEGQERDEEKRVEKTWVSLWQRHLGIAHSFHCFHWRGMASVSVWPMSANSHSGWGTSADVVLHIVSTHYLLCVL